MSFGFSYLIFSISRNVLMKLRLNNLYGNYFHFNQDFFLPFLAKVDG